MTGEIFALTNDETHKEQTTRERAKEWFGQMKSKQRFLKNRTKRQRSEKDRALHHSRGMASPSEFDRKNYGRMRSPSERDKRKYKYKERLELDFLTILNFLKVIIKRWHTA